MSLLELRRCPVGQRHPGVAYMKDKAHVDLVVKQINLTRPKELMYVPYLEPKKNKFVVVPCRHGDFTSCKFEKPLTEEQLRVISRDAYAVWKGPRREPSKRIIDRAAEDMAWTISGPIISYPSSWMETIPDWMKQRVPLERMAQMMRGEKGQASMVEVAVYLYPASLTAPMGRDWSQIYLYSATKAMEDAGFKVPGDAAQRELTDYQMSKLTGLRSWIYKKSRQAFKEKLKAERR